MQNIMSNTERRIIDLVVKYGSQRGDDAKYGTYRMEFFDADFTLEGERIKWIIKQEYADGTGWFLQVITQTKDGYEYEYLFRDCTEEAQEWMAEWVVILAEATEIERKYDDRPFAEVVKEIEESGIHICNRGADYYDDGSIDISTEHIGCLMIGITNEDKAVILSDTQVVLQGKVANIIL